MVYKLKKTNKRRYFKNLQKRKSYKNYKKNKMCGGANDITSNNIIKKPDEIASNNIIKNPDDIAANDIMNKIEEQNKIELPDIAEIPVVGPVLEKTGDLVEGAAVKGLDMIGNSIGVDINNPQSISEKLDNIKESLSDPVNVEKTKEILGNAGKYIEVGIEAAMPVIEKTVDKILPVFTKESDKAVKAGLGTVVNLAEDVAGPFIGIPRTLLSAAEAFNASVNAGSELVKGTAEAIQGTQENFNRIINENIPKIPDMNIPKIPNVSNINMPNMNIPNMNIPNMNIPKIPNVSNMNIPNMNIPKIPNVSNMNMSNNDSLKKYQNEAKMIGGRTNKSQLDFLKSHVNSSQIITQYGGKINTKRRRYLKNKITSRIYK